MWLVKQLHLSHTSANCEQAVVSCLAFLAWQQQGSRVVGAKGNGCGLQQHDKQVRTLSFKLQVLDTAVRCA